MDMKLYVHSVKHSADHVLGLGDMKETIGVICVLCGFRECLCNLE
jgi:hypothetical protein